MSHNASRVKMVLVGLGFGKHIAWQLSQPNASPWIELVGVCDVNPERAAAVSAEFNAPVYPSLDEALADPKVEAIGLYTGPVGRAALIRKIIRAGKDVMTTKPFEIDASEARTVLEEAEALGRTVHLNSPSPELTEDLRTLSAWRDQYDLGRPIACRVSTLANYRDKPDGSWYDDPQQCPAAPIYRLGIYLINDALFFLGKPQSVSVMQSRIFTGRPTSDNAQLSILFENGAMANVFSSFCVADGQPYRNNMVINFERGSLYRNVGAMRKGDPDTISVAAGSGAVVETKTVGEVSGIYQWETFHRSIRDGRISVDIQRVVDAIRIVEAMRRSQESGRIECL